MIILIIDIIKKMTKNKRMWKSSGRDTHKFLMKESFRFLNNKGFEVSVESRIGGGIIDVLGKDKKGKLVGIECSVRPTLSFVRRKVKLYSKLLDKLIFAYPSKYIPKFPIDNFGEVLVIQLPDYLEKENLLIGITVKKSLWKILSQLKLDNDLRSFDEVLEFLLKKKIKENKK